MVLVVRAGDVTEAGWTPGSGRSPGGGHGNPLQCSCLENPMDRGAWQATVQKQGSKEGAGVYHIRLTQLYWVNCYIGYRNPIICRKLMRKRQALLNFCATSFGAAKL